MRITNFYFEYMIGKLKYFNQKTKMKTKVFKSKTLIDKGWSDDKKYCVTDQDGQKYLLRISSPDSYHKKKNEFEIVQQLYSLGIPVSKPIEIGINEEGVYSLQSWIEGTSAEDSISTYSDTEQYVYGLQAGQYLKQIHSIPCPRQEQTWEERFNIKIDSKIEKYLNCPLKYDNNQGEILTTYINSHRHLLKNRPQCFQHGDYHIGNMIIDETNKLNIIDFDRYDFGDPWEEFNRIVFSIKRSPLFSSGMVNGYFDKKVPIEFWELLLLYVACNTLSSLEWSIRYGQNEIDQMRSNCNEVFEWYNSLETVVPNWYFGGYYLQSVDGLFYKLKGPFDFGFLKKFGTVFKVFDDQDSGNICFGIKQEDGRKIFVKFAGAPTEQFNGEPKNAIQNLQSSAFVYESLHHENLIKYIKSEEIGSGFAMIFEWCDGECMGRMYPASRKKFIDMKIELKLKVFDDILSFFLYMASEKFVAIDFYDGSILYDFNKNKTIICDIDFFRKMPVVNDMGRMYGSSLFQSPEELKLGDVIDEISNVYTLGATAFALFADFDRTGKKWILSSNSLKVAQKAVLEERNNRQQSIHEFIIEWKNSLKTL